MQRRFVNLTFCKPDVLKPDVLKPDVLKPDALKPDVLWVYPFFILRSAVAKNCTENPIYVFPEKNLRGLLHNSYIRVSMSNFYIPRMDLPIWLHKNRQTDPGNI